MIQLFTDYGGWPGYPVDWDQIDPPQTVSNNGRATQSLSIGYGNMAQGPYSVGVGIWMASAWHVCADHEHTLTCRLIAQ